MKTKTTNKQLKYCFTNRIGIGYCDAWYLLKGRDPLYYTCGVYGWNTDVYYIDSDTIIQTGYRSFCDNIKPSHELVKKYNDKAKKVYENYNLTYNQQIKKINNLLNKFIVECLEG